MARAKMHAQAMANAAEQGRQPSVWLQYTERRLAAARFTRNQTLMESLLFDDVQSAPSPPPADDLEAMCKELTAAEAAVKAETDELVRQHQQILASEQAASKVHSDRMQAVKQAASLEQIYGLQVPHFTGLPDHLPRFKRRSDLDGAGEAQAEQEGQPALKRRLIPL
eukprot:m.95751 g.95751  ORF g.95751 m.95751 type:complete len:167 (+) comp15163_c0_seq1:199-699(+)